LEEFDSKLIEEYKYPDNEEYNYIITEYSLSGDLVFYEAEVNSGSGIGADYAVFESGYLEEVKNLAKEHLDGLIEMDFSEPAVVLEEGEF
jgi:hypothetical protein